jgi:demethylmenaquinone methyltransferase/2-methoxy-6-polyprenyl-1,4-benzoquinol methylase
MTGDASQNSRINCERSLIRDVYDRRSPYYNVLIEMLSTGRDMLYRREAVRRLGLRKGDRVLDLGCGTGRNFPLILELIGEEGRLVGVDSSTGMLREAEKWIRAGNISNFSLVAGDVTSALFAGNCFDALISTYLFSTVMGWRESLEGHFESLRSGGSFVFADDILPAGWFAGPAVMMRWLFRYGWQNSSRELISFLKEKGSEFRLTRHHMGMIYIASGRKPGGSLLSSR